MWIVKVALQRPYTFIVLAIMIVLLGGYAIANTAVDIFPNIKIPVATVIWRYTGLLPEEMANRIVLFSERIAQTSVNDVEHTESQSVNSTTAVCIERGGVGMAIRSCGCPRKLPLGQT